MKFLPSSSNRRVFGQIANQYDMVYFGTVSQAEDEQYRLVRGLTLSPQQRDENYCVGSVFDYDVTLLERNSTVATPKQPKRRYHWIILQIDLKRTFLPHIFVDGSRRDNELYGSLLATFLRLQSVGYQHFPPDINADFTKAFTIYAQPDAIITIEQIFTPEITTMLAAHFSQFDFEIQDDTLIVYSTDRKVSHQLLDMILRAGLWLARQLDSQIVTTATETQTRFE